MLSFAKRLLVCPVANSPASQMIRGMSEKLEKQESADVKENEMLDEVTLKLNKGDLFEDQRAKEEARELKLRYLNSFTGNSYLNHSYRQKVERLAADPHFDIFFPTISLLGSESPPAEEWREKTRISNSCVCANKGRHFGWKSI